LKKNPREVWAPLLGWWLLHSSLGKSVLCSWCVSNGEGVPTLSLGNREPGLRAPSLERRQMVTRLNSAFHFNIGNVFNSPLFMSLKKGKWRKLPTGNLLTKAQAAQKSRLFPFQVSFQPASRLFRVEAQPLHGALTACPLNLLQFSLSFSEVPSP
jgi:hypothetical protein